MKKQGWETELEKYIEQQRSEPFVWGKNDCVLFAAKAAKVQGVETGPDMESYGEYDKARALEILREHGGDIAALFDKRFNRRFPKASAKRGDIALIEIDGHKAAGIVDLTGRQVAVKTVDSLRHIPIAKALIVWGVD